MASYIRDESTLINSDAQSRSGRALSFDGANDYVQLPDLGITRTTQYTFSVWVYVTLLSAVRPLFGHGNSSSDRNGCHIAADGSVAGGSYNGTAYDGCATASGAIEVNKWHHVVFVRNGGSGDKIYVNGADRTVSGAASNLSISQKVLGTSDNTGLWFHGRMHDARVYSRILTASEIVALYNATKQSGGDVAGTLYAADLAGMWPLEDINTYYVRDMSGNGRDGYWGTLRGFSLTTADSLSGVYLGADVPSSIRNELGYSKIESSELLLQGDFPSGQTSWTSSGQSTFSNGYATVKSTDGSYQYIIYQPSYVKAGRRYKLEYTILANRAGVIASDVINGFTLPSTVGKQTVYFTCYLAGAPEVDAALYDQAIWRYRYRHHKHQPN